VASSFPDCHLRFCLFIFAFTTLASFLLEQLILDRVSLRIHGTHPILLQNANPWYLGEYLTDTAADFVQSLSKNAFTRVLCPYLNQTSWHKVMVCLHPIQSGFPHSLPLLSDVAEEHLRDVIYNAFLNTEEEYLRVSEELNEFRYAPLLPVGNVTNTTSCLQR